MTRQQRWSKFAYERVMSHKGTSDEKKYRTLALGTPSLIQQSGLCQALAFLLGREAGVGGTLVGELARAVDRDGGARELLETAQTSDLPAYLALTEAVLGASAWFRRFAEVELEGEPG